ncbi:MAG: TauD/TfdA family dioxygenase [Pseudomonadota bacterium]
MKDLASQEAPTLAQVAPDPAEIAQAAAQHGVVQVVPPVDGPGGLLALLSKMGTVIFTDGETPAPGYPDLNVVTNAGRTTKPKSVFHSDTTYIARPPSYSALIAIEVPEQGGATLFTDQYAALDALDAGRRALLAGARVLHGPTDVPETEAVWHPLIRRNPVTGHDALFLTALARCRRLELRDGTDRSDLIPDLYAHSIEFQPPRRHFWSRGDVIVWDNRCTLHAADHSAVIGTRTLYRGLVEGEIPQQGGAPT